MNIDILKTYMTNFKVTKKEANKNIYTARKYVELKDVLIIKKMIKIPFI